MKHVHSEIAKAKLDNMELIVLSYCNLDRLWSEDIPRQPGIEFIDSNNTNYFLCLPQHKEFCLRWLNGGDVIVRDHPDDKRERVLLASGYSNWHASSVFMCEKTVIRIKPKKEKRWIGYCASRNQTIPHPQGSEQLAMDYTALHYSYHVNEWQFIEIEIEVTN